LSSRLQSSSVEVVAAGNAEVVEEAEEAVVAVAGGGGQPVVDAAVALEGAAVADAPMNLAVAEGMDFPEVAAAGADEDAGHCAIAVACTEGGNRIGDVDKRQVQFAVGPARGAEALGQAEPGGKEFAAEANNGGSGQ
jgi:hypothetical protein